MPRFSTLPTLFNDCKSLTISDLNRWEYLHPNQFKTGSISWNRNGEKTGSIAIATNTHVPTPYLELDYLYNKTTPISYRVQLVTIPSNLGKGVVWYFVCPRTGKRCRKLHLTNTYFYHRSAFKGCFYEKQTQSHNIRNLGRFYGKLFGVDNAYEKIYSRYFKKKYKGEYTKRYLKLLKQIEVGERLPAAGLLKGL